MSAPANPRPRPVSRSRVTVSVARPLRASLLTAFGLIVLLLLFGNRAATLYTDWLWASSLGYGDLWQRLYGTRFALFFLFGLASFLIAYLNVRLADDLSPAALVTVPPAPATAPTKSRLLFGITAGVGDAPPLNRTLQWLASLRPILDRLLLAGALLFAGAAGLSAQTQWNSFLRYKNPVIWGQSDPLFHHDIGYYVFTLPLLRYVQGWLLTVFLLVGAGVTAVYLYQQGINWIGENHARNYAQAQAESLGLAAPARKMLQPIPPPVRAHLSGLLGLVLVSKAWGYYLDRYDLLYGSGWLPGAGYTDVHIRLPMLHIAMALVLLCALASFINIWRRGIGLPALSLVLWLGFSGLGVLIPGIAQRALVQPNEATLEAPFIANTLAATRSGYGLDNVEVRPLTPVTPEQIVRPQVTNLWNNVPLWDAQMILRQWEQEDLLAPFERIPAVHLDRYPVLTGASGTLETRLTALGVHEITRKDLESSAQSWLNRHVQYTHGLGVTASLTGEAEVVKNDPLHIGLPLSLSARDTPALAELERAGKPQIFFSTSSPDVEYALVKDATATPYRERAGVALTPATRAAFAARYATWSLLLSRSITADTRLLLLRSVSEHVKRIAPFLLLDPAPQPVLVRGRVWWIIPAYTTTSAYPNALITRLSDNLGPSVDANYVRPSVLTVVDAATGAVDLYAADLKAETDPLLRSYQLCFPNTIRPYEDLPTELRAHRRYPLGLMTVQRQVLSIYHVTDAHDFYERSSVWDAPHETEPVRGTLANFFVHDTTSFITSSALDNSDTNQVDVSPRFRMATIDASAPAEFVLQSPLLLKGTSRIAGVLVGRSDARHYGSLLLYKVDTQAVEASRALLTPESIAHRFEEAASLRALSASLSPVPGAGEPVVLPKSVSISSGAVRMVLVNGSVLYVQPIFVTGASGSAKGASNGESPQYEPQPRLWQVRIGDGQHYAEGITLRNALEKLSKERK